MTMFAVEEKFEWAGQCAHEVPERAPEYGAYVCPDVKCLEALAVGVVHSPDLMLCIKWGLGRRTPIRADLYVLLMDGGQDISRVAAHLGRNYDPYDETIDGETFHCEQYVREIFVIEGYVEPR